MVASLSETLLKCSRMVTAGDEWRVQRTFPSFHSIDTQSFSTSSCFSSTSNARNSVPVQCLRAIDPTDQSNRFTKHQAPIATVSKEQGHIDGAAEPSESLPHSRFYICRIAYATVENSTALSSSASRLPATRRSPI